MAATNVVPADTFEFLRLKRELREVHLPLDPPLFSALREAFALSRGRNPQSPRELAEYYMDMSENRRNILGNCARD